VSLVAICIAVVGTVIASEQIHTESLIPSKKASAPPQAHNAPVAAQDEFAPKVSIEPTVQTPDYIKHPTTMVAAADFSSQPTVSSLEGGIPAANAGIRHDDTSAVTGEMDRAINNQGQAMDNRADSVGLPYAIAIVLVAFLGMVSVIRRDTRQDKSSKKQHIDVQAPE
jgi:cobalamin biosynthesis Mg chelatase CobN